MKSEDYPLDAIKEPPHSTEAEYSVLGGLLLDNEKIYDILDLISDKDFYHLANKIIFRAIKAIHAKDQPVDFTTLIDFLNANNMTEKCGGVSYLIDITTNTPSAANIKAYTEIVRERSILRQLIGTCGQIIDDAHNKPKNSNEILTQAERKIFEIADQTARNKKGFQRGDDALAVALERIDYLYQHGGEISGIPTGFFDFDKMTAGLQRSDLIIVAGRPAMGKTTFAMNIAEHIALKNKLPVAVFSMEMSSEQLMMRIISSQARVNLQNIRTGKIQENEWAALTRVTQNIAGTPLYIDESGGLNPSELQARARRLSREAGQLGLIVVDYIQLMQDQSVKENRVVEVSAISRALKLLAKDLNVPIIALSQLNRNLELRPDKRPRMADLRESGSIEQDADIVIFIYRDEIYNPDSPDKGIAEIIISKQRNGPTGTTKLSFLGQFTKFENFTNHYV